MDHLDPAPGAMPAMPMMSREHCFAQPSGGRRRGRPKGSRNKFTLALEAVLEGEAEELMRLLIAKALAGDWPALRFCVGLMLPARRDSPVTFDLPEIENAGDLVKAARALLAACAQGSVSPDEATEVMRVITAVRALEKMGERETRLIALEKRRLACEAKASRAEAAACERRAPPPARLASRRRQAFAVSGDEIEKGMPAAPRVACISPVFNSMTGRVGWAKSAVAAERLLLGAARSCPRGVRGICKSPVFNSTTRLRGWAKSPVAAERLMVCAARICPRGGPSIRVRTARAAPFAHPTRSAPTPVMHGPQLHWSRGPPIREVDACGSRRDLHLPPCGGGRSQRSCAAIGRGGLFA
jgi:hypothetical protein